MESTFTSDKKSLTEVLSSIKDGELQLPDFQRGWVWNDEHVRDLIESVSLAYPIGTIMVLETGGDNVNFKPRPVDGAPSNGISPDHLILDGQQRLTSLYQALYSATPVSTKDPRKKPITRWYYMDIRLALRVDGDRNEAIVSLPEDRRIKNFRGEIQQDYTSRDLEYSNYLFPLNFVFESADWRRGFNAYWQHDPEKAKMFDDFEREVIDRFKKYQVPVIVVKKQTPKEAVCQVFEKVNTGGVSLTVFELLTATFAAENVNLREDWNERNNRIKKHGVLNGVQNTEFLQAIALLVTYQKQLEAKKREVPESEIPGVSCKRKDILRLTVEDYNKWADKVEQGYLDTARFLRRQHIYSARDLPYNTQLTPLAAVFAWLGKAAEPDSVSDKLAQWYWCGVLGELYGSAVESRFARDLPDIVDWVLNGREIPKTIQDANFVPARLSALRTRNSAAYKGIHILLLRKGCLDFRTGHTIEEQIYFEDRLDMHHIFPKNWCDRNRIEPKRRDSIVNKTLISARTNRRIGGDAPSVYLDRLRTDTINRTRLDDILRSHAIDPSCMHQDDFVEFFMNREENLLKLIEEAMCKGIARETTDPELVSEEDFEGLEVELQISD